MSKLAIDTTVAGGKQTLLQTKLYALFDLIGGYSAAAAAQSDLTTAMIIVSAANT